MKKFLLFFAATVVTLFLTSFTMQDKNTTCCRVYGAEGLVVTVTTPIVYSKNPIVKLQLNKRTSEKVAVTVEIYNDKWENIQNPVVTFYPNQDETYVQLDMLKRGLEVCYARLASASCQ